MDVSIIIVNYNTKKLTSECIKSIVEKTKGVDYEIILVDNASTDGSKEVFQKDDRITYIYNEINGGFGYGNNRGMEVAKGKYFFLLNSDTYLENNAIQEFFNYAENHPSNIVYGCYLKDGYGKDCTPFFFFPAFTIKDFLKRIFHLKKESPIDYQDKEVECISGANMFIPRSVIEKSGKFDENIFLYGEEGELQYRFKKDGFQRMVIHAPKIVHLEGQSSTPSLWKDGVKWKSHFYILKKHMLYPTYLLARFYYAFVICLKKWYYIKSSEGRSYLKLFFQ
jgi:GT2 family glycosyltransferase